MANGPHALDEDFVVIESDDLPLRPKNNTASIRATPTIDLHSIDRSTGEVLVSVSPPREPTGGLQHTPCDIVLVIDVSASMNTPAEIPENITCGIRESSGWSILDLVKHASRTILEELNEKDRLAIVTFSTNAKVIQGLLPMTESEKVETRSRLEALTVFDSTNLWAGLREGLDVFRDAPTVGNAQGMYVLTDGVPNHLNPAQGFCKRFEPLLKELEIEKGETPVVSTFGFGYYLRSSLLRSIAEVGRGCYAFIPDAGMIGTVFVHAVANLFSTYATDTELIIECSNPSATIQPPSYHDFNTKLHLNTITMNLGNIQYGQSRNIILKIGNSKPSDMLRAGLRYRVPSSNVDLINTRQKLNKLQFLPQSVLDYHLSRHDLCNFLSSLSYKSQNGEHIALPNSRIVEHHKALEELKSQIETRLLRTPAEIDKTDLAALLADLKPSDLTEAHGNGQISRALRATMTNASSDSQSIVSGAVYGSSTSVPRPQPFYTRWGQHYLPSILHAHAYQVSMSFKDPGPLRYGINSPLFIKCRDDLDNAFDRLPTPEPSLATQQSNTTVRIGSPTVRWCSNRYIHGGAGAPADTGIIKTSAQQPRIQISRFNRVDNACFAGECLVRGTNGTGHLRIDEVRVGDVLWTATGEGRMVREIVVTQVIWQELIGLSTDCRFGSGQSTEPGGLWITSWHPVFINGRWRFPRRVEGAQTRSMKRAYVYSFLLERDTDDMAHTVEVGGITCVTLGHGLVDRDYSDSDSESVDSDVRHHHFFGNYDAVVEDLTRLDTDVFGRRISGGVGKNLNEGNNMSEAYGFLRPDEAVSIDRSRSGRGVKARQ